MSDGAAVGVWQCFVRNWGTEHLSLVALQCWNATSNHGRLLYLGSREVPWLTDINEESLCLAYASYPLLIKGRDQVGSDLYLIFEHKMA